MTLTSQVAVFLAATVIAVPLFRRFKLSAVLGYLAAGVVIGPWGLGLFSDVESILHFSEFGVVLLLFVIGLELQPSRLRVLRRSVFGTGAAQVGLATLALALVARGLGQPWPAAVIIGFALSLSSTALVLQVLAERGELSARHGRSTFAILLFQDLAIMPVLVLLPLAAGATALPQPARAGPRPQQAACFPPDGSRRHRNLPRDVRLQPGDGRIDAGRTRHFAGDGGLTGAAFPRTGRSYIARTGRREGRRDQGDRDSAGRGPATRATVRGRRTHRIGAR